MSLYLSPSFSHVSKEEEPLVLSKGKCGVLDFVFSLPFLFFLEICSFTPSSLSLSPQPAATTKFLLFSNDLQSSLSSYQTIVPFLCQTALNGKIA